MSKTNQLQTHNISMSIQAQLRVQPWPFGSSALVGCVCGTICAVCSALLLSVCAGIKEHQRARDRSWLWPRDSPGASSGEIRRSPHLSASEHVSSPQHLRDCAGLEFIHSRSSCVIYWICSQNNTDNTVIF